MKSPCFFFQSVFLGSVLDGFFCSTRFVPGSLQFDGVHVFVTGGSDWFCPKNYLENKLLLISINFTPKTSNPVA